MLVARAKSKAAGETAKAGNAEEDKLRDLSSERLKYKNFWVGVNRGISIDSKNPKTVGDPTRNKERNYVSTHT